MNNSSWIPEDDLLLKTSIEAGSSLEALAKGTVTFSRGFTLHELRDRWHSLLIDPVISAHASVHMVQVESAGLNQSPTISRVDDLKCNETSPKKRKWGSIHRRCYAMRKRIEYAFFGSPDLGFFEICNKCNHGNNLQDHAIVDHQAQVGDGMSGEYLANNLGFKDTDSEITCQDFPETVESVATTAAVDKSADAFHAEGCHNTIEKSGINRSMREDGLCKGTKNVCHPLLKRTCFFDPSIESTYDTHMHKCDSDKFMGSEELVPSQTIPIGKILKTDELEEKTASAYDSMTENNQVLCSEFGGNHHFNFHGSDGSASSHSMGSSSPLPRLPLWNTMEDISAPDMPIDENSAERNQVTEETLAPPENGENRCEKSTSYHAAQTVSFLGDKADGTDLINSSAITVGEYADPPDSLLNFSDEEAILYINVVAKATMDDNPNSQSLDSPENVPDDPLINADTSTLLVDNVETPGIQCHEELKVSSFLVDQQGVCHWEDHILSSHPDFLQLSERNIRCTLNREDTEIPQISEGNIICTVNIEDTEIPQLTEGNIICTMNIEDPEIPQLTEGNIICRLNIEDPEIPCNDDIFLLIHPSTSFEPSKPQIDTDSIDPFSSGDEMDDEQELNVAKDAAASLPQSQMADPYPCSEFDSAHPYVGHAFKPESSDTKCLDPLSGRDKIRNPGQYQSMLTNSGDERDDEQRLKVVKDLVPSFTQSQMADPSLCSEFDSAHPHVGYTFKSESSDTKCLDPLSGYCDNIINASQSGSLLTKSVLIGDRVLTENVLYNSATYREMSFQTEVGSIKKIDSESMDDHSISEHNNYDGDCDLPCFSDIEALILGIGLEYSQESCITSEVSTRRYNHSNRKILGLEQTTLSSLQRAMSSLGAFAIFYGRHINYSIKKTEVTIGRSTDDTDVDIDLRKEGRANLISRRQATIKMETDGSFTLKNIGKSSISVNGRSIDHGQVAALSSSCSIEIRGMNFMFEINDRYVTQYMDNIIRRNQGKSKTFEWSPEGKTLKRKSPI